MTAYLARVDSQAVVLVLDVGVADGDVGTLANVEGIGVVAALGITVGVVDGDVVEDQVVGLYAESLHGCVLDVQAGDGRVLQLVGVEELGLVLAAVGSLGVPPSGSVTVDEMTLLAGDFNVRAFDADEGTLPLLVSEGSFTPEDDLYSSY